VVVNLLCFLRDRDDNVFLADYAAPLNRNSFHWLRWKHLILSCASV
jgi:hypothetical protein